MSEVFSSVRNINEILMPPIIISEALLRYIHDKKNYCSLHIDRKGYFGNASDLSVGRNIIMLPTLVSGALFA